MSEISDAIPAKCLAFGENDQKIGGFCNLLFASPFEGGLGGNALFGSFSLA